MPVCHSAVVSEHRHIIAVMANRMTRRQLGLAALATAALEPARPAATPNSGYTGALGDVQNKVNMQDFDPVYWTVHDRYATMPLRLTFRATDKAGAEAWQQELRAKLKELLGGFPARTPLSASVLETRE